MSYPLFILVGMETGSAADIIRNSITADSREPYAVQLANQLLAFASLSDVNDLAPDDLAELLLVMANAAEQLETQTGHVAMTAHRRGVGRHIGSSSTGAWLAHKARVTPAHAHRMIRRSETENAFALFYYAHQEGRITGYHLDHLGCAPGAQPPDLKTCLTVTSRCCATRRVRCRRPRFGMVCQKWLYGADPDGSYDKFLRNLERRYLKTARDLDGNVQIAGQLDPISGEAFLNLVGRRAKELFDADWAKAKAEAAEGETITKGRLRRSDAQRRLDALVSLVIDGSSTPEDAQRPEPLLFFGLDSMTFEDFLNEMLTTDLDHAATSPAPGTDADGETTDDQAGSQSGTDDTGAVTPDQPPVQPGRSELRLPATAAAVDPSRRCETGHGHPIPFRIMLQQLLTCRIRRVVWDAPNVIINAGETRRLFTPTQRQLIRHRDRCCSFPGCHRDAIYCETDHILAVTNHGPTDLANGQCLCRYHHQLKTRGRFTCQRLPDGRIGFYLPTGIQIE